MTKKQRPYHYKKVLYVVVRYSDERHKPSQWLNVIESDFPDAAKKFIRLEKVEVKRKRIYA